MQDQSWTFWKERGREHFPEQGVGCDWAAPGQRAGERAHPDQCCPGRRRQRLYPEAGAAAGGLCVGAGRGGEMLECEALGLETLSAKALEAN